MTTNRFLPNFKMITGITNAQYAVVTFDSPHSFVLNEIVSFRVSPSAGMKEMNNLRAKVLATTSDTITVNIDSTNFGNFHAGETAYTTVPRLVTFTVGFISLLSQIGLTDTNGIVPFTMFISFNNKFYRDTLGNGTLTGTPSGSGTIDYSTGDIQLTGELASGLGTLHAFSYFGKLYDAFSMCVPVGSGIDLSTPFLIGTILNDAFDNVRV
jgi:hypothetical protein